MKKQERKSPFPHNRIEMKLNLYIISIISLIFFSGCSSTSRQVDFTKTDKKPFPIELSDKITDILPSVVEVVTVIEYEIHEYVYALDANGNYIRDTSSSVGFRFASTNPDSMILKRMEHQVVFGSGVLIGQSSGAYLLLTSRHVVSHKDSLIEYIRIEKKKTTAPLFKAYLRKHDLAVRGNSNILVAARRLADEVKSDLALLAVSSQLVSGRVLTAKISPRNSPKWGRLAVVVGFPDEIKQASIGLTGEAPYPGNFSISTYGDFGYSGGPVFAYSPPDGLIFIGIGRSIPAKTIFYIAPDENIQSRHFLMQQDIKSLRIQRLHFVNPSRMYAINMKYVADFIKKNYLAITGDKFILSGNFRKLLSF